MADTIEIPKEIDTLIYKLIYYELSEAEEAHLAEWIATDSEHLQACVARGKAYWKMKRLFEAEH